MIYILGGDDGGDGLEEGGADQSGVEPGVGGEHGGGGGGGGDDEGGVGLGVGLGLALPDAAAEDGGGGAEDGEAGVADGVAGVAGLGGEGHGGGEDGGPKKQKDEWVNITTSEKKFVAID